MGKSEIDSFLVWGSTGFFYTLYAAFQLVYRVLGLLLNSTESIGLSLSRIYSTYLSIVRL